MRRPIASKHSFKSWYYNLDPNATHRAALPGASALHFMASPIDSILHQSPLHLVNYALVGAVLFRSIWQAFTLRALEATLHSEAAKLLAGTRDGDSMLHPIANVLIKMLATPLAWNVTTLRQAVEHYEAALFVPLRSQITLTRDISTLMGLVATCTALVTAGADFAKHGRPELLVGSVSSGTISTCIAAIGCMLSLWTSSRLTQLRVRVASEIEEWLLEPLQAREAYGSLVAPATLESATSTSATGTGPGLTIAPRQPEEINYAI